MSAHVLVVPSKLYTRVRPDGSFRLEGSSRRPAQPGGLGPELEASPAHGERQPRWGPGELRPASGRDQGAAEQGWPGLRVVRMITTTSLSRDNGRGVGRANGPRLIAGLMAVAAAGISLALAVGKVGLAPADPGPMTRVADAVRRDVQSWIHSQVDGLAEIGRRAAAHPG